MTHKQLVDIGYRWVLKCGGATVAFRELHSMAREIPDVIGFNSWESVLIECKASRADFLQDKKKPHRDKGMGNWRFYCCPKGLIRPDELPEKWGLIYVTGGRARVVVDCRVEKLPHPYEDGQTMLRRAEKNRFDCDQWEERAVMFTALRRLFIRGLMPLIYEQRGPAKNVVL